MFLHWKIYFLVLNYFISSISCGYINSTTHGTQKASRNGRFFGLFNIVSFRDDECNSTTNGVRGVCLLAHACADKGDTAMGSCAMGFGVCCVSIFTRARGDRLILDRKIAYIRNNDFPNMNNEAGSYSLLLRAKDEDTVRIRLDFIQFVFPRDVPTAPAPAMRQPDCQQNQMTISNIDAADTTVNIGELCGNNNDQHVYIHLPKDKAARRGRSSEISFRFGGTQQYRYNIMVTQLDESRPTDWPKIARSGAGCHQFYSEPTGRITSFNFDRLAPAASSYQRNLNYNMCVDPYETQKCEVRFEITMNNQMQIANNAATYCGSASCGGRGTGGTTECVVNDNNAGGTLNSDYLYIDGAFSTNDMNAQIRSDYYCGNMGLGWQITPNPNGMSRVVTRKPGVAQLSFVTDMRDAAAVGTPTLERGFSLTYDTSNSCQ